MSKRVQQQEQFKAVQVLQPRHLHMAIVLATGGQPHPILVTWKGQTTGREVRRVEPVGVL